MNVISFIGNCQTITLCYFFQQLFDIRNYTINYLMYGQEFMQHLGPYSYKCKNRYLDYSTIEEQIKKSDYIIFQEIELSKSNFSNPLTLRNMTKKSCKLIKIPSIYYLENKSETSLKELKLREEKLNVDIKVSKIIEKFNEKKLMLTHNHPTTFFFLEILKELIPLIAKNQSFFSEEQVKIFLKDPNYMRLPRYTHPSEYNISNYY